MGLDRRKPPVIACLPVTARTARYLGFLGMRCRLLGIGAADWSLRLLLAGAICSVALGGVLPPKGEWSDMPSELTSRIRPLETLQLKVGKTSGDIEFLRIRSSQNQSVALGVRDADTDRNSYLVSAKQAVYWPSLHLLRLSGSVVVSASACRLEGSVFDIHLQHDTSRMVEPAVITLASGIVPIQSDELRIGGLMLGKDPYLEWVGVGETAEMSSSVADQNSQGFLIEVQGSGDLSLDGTRLDSEQFRQDIRSKAAQSPDAVFTIRRSSDTSISHVQRIHNILKESGFDRVKTETEPVVPRPQKLDARAAKPRLEDQPFRLPPGDDPILVWVQAVGRYRINKDEMNEPTFQRVLRQLAATAGDRTIILAGSSDVPPAALKSLEKDLLEVYKFDDVRLSLPPSP